MSGTQNTNPGNFANRPKEEVRNIASKGGQASHSGGFASMDPDKQRDIASKGGQASSGSFEPGSERAREAGRKGGSRTGGTGGDDAE
ncbi:Conidiation-specific protein 10 [Parachaetomium inaequale]|uniref:Conidiation-specific protein 10 n=1 Tax=Parachaetomium inaequale TaxID=2588326 RepID=A0AAN6P822_9PEZI|nr:Conidiation-specific protein 10 [Parachaetomium inaequale]